MACLISAAKLAASRFTPDWQRLSVLESVFDQLSDALVLWDPEFRITGVNRAAERLFGMSSEEMLGKHCQEVFRCYRGRAGVRSAGGIGQAAHGAPYDRPPEHRKRDGAPGGDAYQQDIRRLRPTRGRGGHYQGTSRKKQRRKRAR